MRTLVFVCLVHALGWSQANLNPKRPPTAVQEGTKRAPDQKDTASHQQAANDEPTLNQGKVKSSTETKTASTIAEQQLEINRKLANLTAGLVAVGIIQFLALIAQGIIFWHSLQESRKATEATGRAADAAKASAETAIAQKTLMERQTGAAETSAKAAMTSATTAQQALQVVERAYISIAKIGFSAEPPATASALLIDIRNAGRTQATVDNLQVLFTILAYNIATSPKLYSFSLPGPLNIGPDSIQQIVWPRLFDEVGALALNEIKMDRAECKVKITLSYKDVFEKSYTIKEHRMRGYGGEWRNDPNAGR